MVGNRITSMTCSRRRSCIETTKPCFRGNELGRQLRIVERSYPVSLPRPSSITTALVIVNHQPHNPSLSSSPISPPTPISNPSSHLPNHSTSNPSNFSLISSAGILRPVMPKNAALTLCHIPSISLPMSSESACSSPKEKRSSSVREGMVFTV